MVRYGMAWSGMVPYAMVLYGMVWCGIDIVWHVWYGEIWWCVENNMLCFVVNSMK